VQFKIEYFYICFNIFKLNLNGGSIQDANSNLNVKKHNGQTVGQTVPQSHTISIDTFRK